MSHPPAGISYRPDIDGLRAIAVLLVLAYHAFPAWVPAGFIGVDVFFVISGYLITGILLKDLLGGHYTLQGFYAKRIRRLFPALVTMLVVVCAASQMFAHAEENLRLSWQVLAGGGFFSNWWFWGESGYFDRAAESKPLLHLWSLAVEEQYYLIWPPVLAWAWRRGVGFTAVVFVGLIATSFGSGLWMLHADRAGAYFAPWSRFWEMWCGAALATWQFNKGLRKPEPSKSVARWSGGGAVIALAVALVCIDASRAFPGAWAVLPVTVAVAALSGQSLWLSRCLSHPALVRIGLISYPLYLWHWPLIVWADLELSAWPEWQRRVLALLLSLLAAEATRRFVEEPLRFSRRSVVPSLLLAMLVVMAWAGWQIQRDGRPFLVSAHQAQVHETLLADLRWQDADDVCLAHFQLQEPGWREQQLFCRATLSPALAELALLGDSTANALFPGLAAQGRAVVNLGNGTCPPLPGVEGQRPWNRACHEVNAKARRWVLSTPSIRTVILSWAPWDAPNLGWPSGRQGESAIATDGAQQLTDMIQQLRDAGKRVVLVFDTPSMPGSPESCLPRRSGWPVRSCRFSEMELLHRQPWLAAWQRVVEQLPRDGVCVASVSRWIVGAAGDYTPLAPDGRLWFRDGHHLSESGSRAFAAELVRQCPLN